MTKKVIHIRHMKERRNDHVAHFLNQIEAEQYHANPAHGVPLPAHLKMYDALIIYGGIQSANDGKKRPYIADELNWIAKWLRTGKPALGLCLGAQLIAKSLGATVARHPDGLREVGFKRIVPTEDAGEFLTGERYFYQWHNEGFSIPDKCELLAKGDIFPNQAFRYRDNVYGFQFHPEVSTNVMNDWLESSTYILDRAGADSAEKQRTDEVQYGTSMKEWIMKFMDSWHQSW